MKVDEIDQVVSSLRASLAGGEADSSCLGVSTETLDAVLAKYEEMRATTTVMLTNSERTAERLIGLQEALAIVVDDGRNSYANHHTRAHIECALDSYRLQDLYAEATKLRAKADLCWKSGDMAESQKLHEYARTMQTRIGEAVPYEEARRKAAG